MQWEQLNRREVLTTGSALAAAQLAQMALPDFDQAIGAAVAIVMGNPKQLVVLANDLYLFRSCCRSVPPFTAQAKRISESSAGHPVPIWDR
jgi:hypothetical protein